MRTAKCRICREAYEKRNMGQVVCSPKCAQAWAEKKRDKTLRQQQKEIRREHREQRERLKTRQQWLRDAQTIFNRYIRLRDHDLPCISCGRHHNGAYDAGHYRSVGAAPQLRFDERNVHKQCVPCNQHKSGNAIEYRMGLGARLGLLAVVSLESDNTVKRWTIDDAKEIIRIYRAKIKELQNGKH